METVVAYFEPTVKALAVGFLIYLPFLMNRYLIKAQELNRKRK